MKFKKVETKNEESKQRFESKDKEWVITEDQNGKWAAFRMDKNNRIEEEVGTGAGGPSTITELDRILGFEVDIITPRWVDLDQEQKEYFRGLVRDYLEEASNKKVHSNITRTMVYNNLNKAKAYYNTNEPDIAFYN